MNTSTSSRIIIITLTIVCAALAAATGVSVKHARDLDAKLKQTAEAVDAPVSENTGVSQSAPAPKIEASSTDPAALLTENARLREQIAALSAANVAAGTNAVLGANARPPRESFMARLQREDPARYRQIIQQREDRRKQAQQQYQDQLATLDQRAQTAQTQEEVDLTTQIADTLNKIQQLRQNWAGVRDLPEDQQAAAIEQLRADTRDAYSTLSDLRDQDRTMQLQQLATQYGVKDTSGAQQFSDSVQQIYKSTQYNTGPGGRGGFGGPGGPPPEGGTQPPPTSSQSTTQR